MEKKKEESVEKEELTLQNVPKAVNYLINEIAEMRAVLEHIESQLGLGVDKHRFVPEKSLIMTKVGKYTSLKMNS